MPRTAPLCACLALALLTLALHASPAAAWNYSLSVKNDDRRVIDLGVFGFSDDGRMNIRLKSFDLREAEALASTDEKVGFTLDLVDTAVFARQEKNYAKGEGARSHLCFVDDKVTTPRNRYNIPLQTVIASAAARRASDEAAGVSADDASSKKKKRPAKKKKAEDADAGGDDVAPPPPPPKKKKKKKAAEDEEAPAEAAGTGRALLQEEAAAEEENPKPKKKPVKKKKAEGEEDAPADDAAPPPPPPKKKKKKKAEDEDAAPAPAADDDDKPKKKKKKAVVIDGDVQEEKPKKKSKKKKAMAPLAINANASFKVRSPGLYALFYYNCKNLDGGTTGDDDKAVDVAKSIHTSFTVDVEQWNVLTKSDGSTAPSFVSIGDNSLPAMYLLFAAFFIAGLVSWHRALAEKPARVQKVHWVMYALMVVKSCQLLLEAAVWHHRKSTGALQWSVDWIYYTVSTLKGVVLFTVILMLGTGWSVLKPFLSDRDKNVLMALVPLQVIVNVAIAVVDHMSEGSKSWLRWRDTLRILDVACCCAVLLPVVWSIKTLKDAASTDGKAARNLSRLRQFRTFYVAVVAFIYFTRIVLVLVENSVPFQLTWLPHFLYEAAAVIFYTFCGVRFRPVEPESLFAPAEAEEAGEVDLDDDEEMSPSRP